LSKCQFCAIFSKLIHHFHHAKGENVMGNVGKKDKGNKEQKKKPKLSLKEKRKLKNEKKNQ